MGKPVHFNGTSLGLTSRTGTGNDPYVEMENGSLVVVSPANKGRIRLNLALGIYEQSINGGPWTPLGLGGNPSKEPTGFPNRTDTVISFDNASRFFYLSPTGVTYDYWIKGVKYTTGTFFGIAISNAEGLHFIYLDGLTIKETTAFSASLLSDYALVGCVYWDVSAAAAIFIGDERHEFMPWQTHYELHTCLGTQYLSGLALTSILADQSGALDTHAQLGVQAGSILDEDLIASIAAKAAPAQIPVYYRSGAAGEWNADVATNFPVKPFAVGGRIAYNQNTGVTWQQADPGTNGRFVLAHLFATNDISAGRSVIAIQGQAFYTNITAARQGANTELLRLLTDGLPLVEFKPIGSVIFETSTAYGNTIKARIRTTDTGATYIDWRGSKLSPVVVSLPGGTDATAYHSDIPGEIAATPIKATPVSADLLLIEDSAALNAKKSVQVGSLTAGSVSFKAEIGETLLLTNGAYTVGVAEIVIPTGKFSGNGFLQMVQYGTLPGASLNQARVSIQMKRGAGGIYQTVYDPGVAAETEVIAGSHTGAKWQDFFVMKWPDSLPPNFLVFNLLSRGQNAQLCKLHKSVNLGGSVETADIYVRAIGYGTSIAGVSDLLYMRLSALILV